MKRQKLWGWFWVWLGLLVLVGNGQAQTQDLEQRLRQLEEALQSQQQANTFRVYWQDGFFFETADKAFKLQFGGQLQNDWNFTFPSDAIKDAFGDPEDRIFIRRAQIWIAGTLYNTIDFKTQYNFSGGDVNFEDIYLRVKRIPVVGRFTIGKFKVPFGLEQLTSDRFVTLQERSLTDDAFAPGREIGVTIGNAVLNQRLTWALAATRETDNDTTLDVAGSGDDWNAALRLTGVPWYVDKGRRLVHLGFAYAFRNFVEDEARYRAQPEARLKVDGSSVRFVDTGVFDAKTGHQIGLEGALVYGPFSLQGEYMLAFELDAAGGLDPTVTDAIEDATFHAFYVMVSYFLTGEQRPYRTSSATFGRPKPKQNFLRGGYGAWELAIRLSHLDLADAADFGPDPTRGGKQLNLTFGIIWYPNPNTRVTMNYVHAIVDDRVVNGVSLDDDGVGIFMMRFQVDF